MNKLKYIVLALALGLMFNCKSSKRVTGNDANLRLSTRQLIKENAKQVANFKTIQSKLKINYQEGDKSQTYSVSFRAEKDKAIWMSAAFSVVKVLITPEKVSFYNKLDNTYFEGDFTYLSNLLGTELDFQKVQNLLYGETIYNLFDSDYTSQVDDNMYVVQPKNQRELFEIFFLLDPVKFKVQSQQISQPKAFRHLQIDYLSYQNIGKQLLPENIKVIAVEANEELIVNLEFRNVSLNEDLKFPFKIPSGFKEIQL
ncbi:MULTISPECIES: DUF4292 domain-containing protein [Aestuariibaculum]|uniref:DUF4292 domain-containing protein n=1 Tax=Aestuariibaculum lutulentum TaxID=2920935 RepID=A0ABS9RIY2_9FLAO|nr:MULTISPECIES: DUF4292 domain-containing protein [Aestuariibaculum]MCH4552072.1 DUF4292 domain-containing protein [Aestuariibaculum lutulentum]MCR8667167.1 DUF4292 domain-containing protein [Aestuariibaculum sp. M13]